MYMRRQNKETKLIRNIHSIEIGLHNVLVTDHSNNLLHKFWFSVQFSSLPYITSVWNARAAAGRRRKSQNCDSSLSLWLPKLSVDASKDNAVSQKSESRNHRFSSAFLRWYRQGTFLLEHLCSHTDTTSKRLSVESEPRLSFHIVEISAVISICIGDAWDLG